MTPQESVLDAVLRARGILAEYIEPGPRDCAQTLSRLFVIFDDEKLTTAISILSLEAVSATMAEANKAKHTPASPPRRRTTG